MRTTRTDPRRRAALAAVAFLLVGGFASQVLDEAGASAKPADVESINSEEFLDSIGINIHDTYNDTTYARNDDAAVTLTYLKRLGVRWVRIGLKTDPPSWEKPLLQSLRSRGVHILGVTGSPRDAAGGFQTGQSAQLVEALTDDRYAGLVDMIELPNEQDLFGGGASWAHDVEMYDEEYYRALKANPTTAVLPVLGPSVAFATNFSKISNRRASQQIVNLHAYGGSAPPENNFLDNILRASNAKEYGQPAIVTETGYSDARRADNTVSQRDASLFLPRTLLWNRTHGVSRTFIYELLDEKPDASGTDRELHFGLVSVRGKTSKDATWTMTPKDSFKTLRRMIQRLQQNTCTYVLSVCIPRQIHLGGVSQPDQTQAVVLRHSDGALDLAVWSSAPSGTRSTVSVTVRGASRAQIYSLATGRSRELQIHANRVSVSVGPSVRLLRLL